MQEEYDCCCENMYLFSTADNAAYILLNVSSRD